jgi:flagellar protein FliS
MDASHKYLAGKVLTASKEELMLMLFDGAIRFSGIAREKLLAREYEASCQMLIRGQDIMVELMSGLRREELGDRIFDNLVGLYQSISNRLMKANVRHDPSMIDDAVKLLSHLRETWSLSIEKDRRERLESMAPAAASGSGGGGSRSPLNLEG